MHQLIVCGLNHHSSPIAIRERFAIPDSCISHALRGLASLPSVIEAMLLSTCNRTEVYAVVTDVKSGLAELENFFLSVQSISDHEALKPNFKLLRDDVALHLLRVASGLDSMVLGESQIMSQVKNAYRAAREAGTIGPVLDQLLTLALKCGKRVRTETSLGRRAVSVSSAAVELARNILLAPGHSDTTIIGAGKMARICMKYLACDQSSGKLNVLNRSSAKLARVLEDCPQQASRIDTSIAFEHRHLQAAASRLTIVATSAPDYLLRKETFLQARKQLAEQGSAPEECLLIDISVPRNIDPAIADIPGITLKHADDLAGIVDKNLKERQSLVGEAEEIIFEILDEYHDWKRSRLVVPTIAGLREKIEAIRLEHINRGQGSCPHKEDAESLSRAIINQILHHPTVQLKATTDYQVLKQQAEALKTLFNLELGEPSHLSLSRPASMAGL